MIIGLSGFIGVGKDSVARALSNWRGAPHTPIVGLADPLKRIAYDVFKFNPEHLWGDSALRDIPDTRYPNPDLPEGFLTPRHALKELGTRWGRGCYQDVWVNYLFRESELLLTDGRYGYIRESGVRQMRGADTPWIAGDVAVLVPDCRFKNEMSSIRARGGYLVRIKRQGLEEPSSDHPSESEQAEIPDSYFDYVFHNDGPLEELGQAATSMLNALRG